MSIALAFRPVAADLGSWLDAPLASLAPWSGHPLALQTVGRSAVEAVTAIYLGAYAAAWLSSTVSRRSGGWYVEGAPAGPTAVACHVAERLSASTSTLHAARLQARDEALEDALVALDYARFDLSEAVDGSGSSADALQHLAAVQTDVTRLQAVDSDPATIGPAVEALRRSAALLVSSASYRSAFLSALRESLSALGSRSGSVAPADALAPLLDGLEPGSRVRRSAIREALTAAGVDLDGLDLDGLLAEVGLVRPNASGRLSGIHVYVLQEVPS